MRHLSRFLICFSLFFATLAHASIPEAEIDRVAHSKGWLRLLHYKSKWLRHDQSIAQGGAFFLSPNGKYDPKAELEATLAALPRTDLKVGRLGQTPRCAFPARYDFLRTELKIDVSDQKCEKLAEFLARLQAKYPTLVFSSAYPNNPGSMFGHTFLKFKSGIRPDILDWAISFAANVGDDNGIVFMYKGITGGYPGAFSMLPYYQKINEYTNSESRDLHEYDLNMTVAETDRLLKHLWEVETSTTFDYYFIDENCSYQLLAALEVARPDWDLSDFYIHVIPSETIRRITETPGAVRATHFRPALRKKLLQHYEGLSSDQRTTYQKITDRKAALASVADIPVLDTVDIYFQYLKQKNDGKLADEDQAFAREVLIRRSELGSGSADAEANLPPFPSSAGPEFGHPPYRIGTSGGVQTAQAQYFQELSFKFAYHDLLNNDLGYSPFSHIDFPNLTLRYIPAISRLQIEDLTFIEVTSLFPINFLEKSPSWHIALRYMTPKDFGCATCHVVQAEGGAGLTVDLGTPNAILYALGLVDLEAGSSLANGVRFDPRLQLATLLNPWQSYKLKLEGDWVADLFQEARERAFYQFSATQSYSLSSRVEVRGQGDYYVQTLHYFSSYREAKLTLNYYF